MLFVPLRIAAGVVPPPSDQGGKTNEFAGHKQCTRTLIDTIPTQWQSMFHMLFRLIEWIDADAGDPKIRACSKLPIKVLSTWRCREGFDCCVFCIWHIYPRAPGPSQKVGTDLLTPTLYPPFQAVGALQAIASLLSSGALVPFVASCL